MNIDKTNYLKGLAIIAVCINHFLNGYVDVSLAGYANGFISIFFMLSGYGIYLSLNKEEKLCGTINTAEFFKKRVARIFPLFWVWCALAGFSNGWLGFFALDFVNPISPWFVPAILQCYLLAPFLFLLTKKINSSLVFFVVTLSFVVLVNLLTSYADIAPVSSVAYRGVFFLHIFLFMLGYILAEIKFPKHLPALYSTVLFIAFVFLIQETTPQQFIIFPGKELVFPIILSLLLFCFCICLFNSSIRLPFKKAFNFAGVYSYSIYLFSGKSDGLLNKLGIIDSGSTEMAGIIFWALTLPIFILIFATFETIVNEFVFGNRSIYSAIKTFSKNLGINIK